MEDEPKSGRSESRLHAALKDLYSPPGARQEILVDGYWIDVVDGERLIEIQTRNFTALKGKLAHLLPRHPVRVVHPVAVEKWIVTLPADGSRAQATRRKSPRRGRVEQVFNEMVRIPDLLAHPNFSLEVILIREEELRRRDGRGSWRRGGVSITDRRLLDVVERREFQSPQDLAALLPQALPETFTNRTLAEALHIPPRLAARMTYCLRALHVLELAGKDRRRHLYRFVSREEEHETNYGSPASSGKRG